MLKRIVVILAMLGSVCATFAQDVNERERIKEEIKQEVIAELQTKKASPLRKITERIQFGGKALFRATELDWKQERMKPDGTLYSDGTRYWSRYNFYLHMDVKLSKEFKIHSRVRTGNKQYSFVTFGGNKDERFNIILDKLYLQWSHKGFELKLGRQSAGVIWKNQKGAQFDIPTHDGISLSKEFKLGTKTLSPKLAFFDEKYRNNTGISEHGKVYGASLILKEKKANISWHAQTGIILADHLPNRYENDIAEDSKEGTRYHDGDLAAKYKIWTNQVKISFHGFYDLSLTCDYYRNFEKYDANPDSHLIKATEKKAAPDFSDENQGFISTVSVGNYSKIKSLYAGISYLYLEKYATMDYFAQYDFARWASSNIQGVEFCLGYRFHKNIAVKGRLFTTEELKGYNAINPNYKRSANRVRIDININF